MVMEKVFILAALVSLALASSDLPAPSSLTDDDLHALLQFSQDFSPKDPSWTAQTPPCKWAGVGCGPIYPPPSNATVTDLQWNNGRRMTGTFNGTNLPLGVTYVSLSGNKLSGTPDLTSLPAALAYLDLGYNEFCGTSRINLPCRRHFFFVQGNCSDATHTVTFVPCKQSV